jgi:hypothetical protein
VSMGWVLVDFTVRLSASDYDRLADDERDVLRERVEERLNKAMTEVAKEEGVTLKSFGF